MKYRFLAALLAMAMCMSAFVGCESSNGATTVANITTTEEETTTTAEETTTTAETTTTTAEKTTTKKTATTKLTTRWTMTLDKTTKADETTTTNAEETTTTNAEETTTTEDGTTTSSRRTVASRSKTTTKATTTTSKMVVTSATNETARTDEWAGTFPIKVSGTIEERAAAVNNDLKGKQPIKITSEKAEVTSFNKDWAFTHHPGLVHFKGKWYASFSQGIKDEDAPGQRVVVSSSEDFFNWSEPVVVGPAIEGWTTPGTGYLTANIPAPVFACDGKMIITYGVNSYHADKFDSKGRFKASVELNRESKSYAVMTEDGENWSEPFLVRSYLSNDTLRQTATGRWFASYGTSARYSDEIIPNGLIWQQSSLSGAQRSDAIKRNGGAVHTESSWFQTEDHVLHIMVRSETGFLWMMESYDNGKTWSDLYPTNFGSCSTMWKFGELPDGRIFGIGTSGNKNTSRNKLEMWISEDGVNFDKCYILRDEAEPEQQQYGWAKGGRYAYPAVQIRDGYLHVLYSRNKEFMEVTRVKLSDIK